MLWRTRLNPVWLKQCLVNGQNQRNCKKSNSELDFLPKAAFLRLKTFIATKTAHDSTFRIWMTQLILHNKERPAHYACESNIGRYVPMRALNGCTRDVWTCSSGFPIGEQGWSCSHWTLWCRYYYLVPLYSTTQYIRAVLNPNSGVCPIFSINRFPSRSCSTWDQTR